MFEHGGSATTFVAALGRFRRPVVIDWGFPPHWLPVVETLKRAGVEIWWFDGDRAAARQSFISRATISIAALDTQMAAMETAWPDIKRVFGTHILKTVKQGPRYADWKTVFAQMFVQPTADHRKRAR